PSVVFVRPAPDVGRRDEARARLARQNRHAVPDLEAPGGLKRLAHQLRHDLTRRFLVHRGQLLRSREHVVVQIEGCPHLFSITNHASDVKPGHPADAVLWLPTAEHRWPNAKRPVCSTTSTPAVPTMPLRTRRRARGSATATGRAVRPTSRCTRRRRRAT